MWTHCKKRFKRDYDKANDYLINVQIPVLEEHGFEVKLAGKDDDLMGIDIYIDGIPAQVKYRFTGPDPYLQGARGNFKDDLDTPAELWMFSSCLGHFLWRVSDLKNVRITNTWFNDHGRKLRFFNAHDLENLLNPEIIVSK